MTVLMSIDSVSTEEMCKTNGGAVVHRDFPNQAGSNSTSTFLRLRPEFRLSCRRKSSRDLPRHFRLQVKSVEGEGCEDANEPTRREAKARRTFDFAEALDELNESLKCGDLACGHDGVQSPSRVPPRLRMNSCTGT